MQKIVAAARLPRW